MQSTACERTEDVCNSFVLWGKGQIRRTSLWVPQNKRQKRFHWLWWRAELGLCTATGSALAYGLRVFSAGCGAPSGRPKDAYPLGAAAQLCRVNILCFCLGDLLPAPSLAARLKRWRGIKGLISPLPPLFFFGGGLFPPPMKSLKAKNLGKRWFQPAYWGFSWSACRESSTASFNTLLCLRRRSLQFPPLKKLPQLL